VTFSPESEQPTPDQGAASPDPKRKRISSQNFQRLARRISISGRRSGSSSSNIPGIANLIPGLKRGDSSAKESGGESARASVDASQVASPTPPPRDSSSVKNAEGATPASPPQVSENIAAKLRKNIRSQRRKTMDTSTTSTQ